MLMEMLALLSGLALYVLNLTLTNDGASWTMTNAMVHITGGGIFNLTGGQLDMTDTVIITRGSRFGGSRPSRQGTD